MHVTAPAGMKGFRLARDGKAIRCTLQLSAEDPRSAGKDQVAHEKHLITLLIGTKLPALGGSPLSPCGRPRRCNLSRSCRRSQAPEPRCLLDRYNQNRRATAPTAAELER